MATDRVLALVALAALAVALCALEVRRNRTARAVRDAVFDGVRGVLDDARLLRAPGRHPVLTGSHRGHPVRVEAVVDTLVPRKLPVLWLLVTVRRPFDLDGPVSALARPVGTEFFSPNASFVHRVPTPAGFPVHARIATARPTTLPAAALDALADLLRDPAAKEVQAGPTGARVVHRLAEAAQTPYRTSRRADFGTPRLAPATLTAVLDGLDALAPAPVPAP